MPKKWKNKTALITGASAGLGAAFAQFLAGKGIHVVLIARREKHLHDLRERIAAVGGDATCITADLSRMQDREKLYKTIKQSFSCVDVLINNAGFGWYGYFHEMTWDIARRMAEVNMLGMVHLTKLFLPDMIALGSGHIINIGSIAGGLPNQGIAMYSGSKAFIDAFNTSLSRELRGTGVHSNVMRLGPVKTEFYSQARKRVNGRSIPAERLAISTERVCSALWRLMNRPRRVMYVPSWLVVSRYVENLFGGLIDLVGPLLLKRGDRQHKNRINP